METGKETDKVTAGKEDHIAGTEDLRTEKGDHIVGTEMAIIETGDRGAKTGGIIAEKEG